MTATADKPYKPGVLERLGLRYWYRMARRSSGTLHATRPDDNVVARRVQYIVWGSLLLCFAVSAVFAWLSVWHDLWMTDQPNPWVRYAWVIGVLLLLCLIEFVVLTIIALEAVFRIARAAGVDVLGPIEQVHLRKHFPEILTRAALETPDPVMKFLDVDPMRYVSRKRLFVFGILYKIKVFASNFTVRNLFKYAVGKTAFRVSIDYVAVPISGLWSLVVMHIIIRHARLRIFGAILATELSDDVAASDRMHQLSPLAREGCIRAVANTVVMAQNYHPNMLVLLAKIYTALGEPELKEPDSFDRFSDILAQVDEGDRNYLWDLLAVATAFDGKFSRLEREQLARVYGSHWPEYKARILRLKQLLAQGRLTEARSLCQLDEVAG